MLPTLHRAAAHRPLIKFIGKHVAPASVSHTPEPHPASPSHSLPESFASYRQKAQQHGPLNGGSSVPYNRSFNGQGMSYAAYGAIGGHSGHELGSVKPPSGQAWDRSELPKRFTKMAWSAEEMEAVESGGASKVW